MARSADNLPPPPPIDPSALRLVLFGMPDAGKSSLLGALAQAAQVQERQLQGRLFDTSSGLAELQRRVYDEKPRETLQEIVPYPVRFEPFKGQKPDPTQRIDAVLIDCDGRVANEILTQSKSIDDPGAGSLVGAVRGADALVFVVDASATDELIDSDFGEFVRFMHLLEASRTERTEIGGLPVFLVLSKCDLLARAGDAAANWNNRIEERRQQLQLRFNEFLDAEDEAAHGFGSLAVEVGTTAVRRPAFFGAAAAREPYGVADLFRRVFFAARDYRSRANRSSRRTLVLATSAAVLLTAMIAGAVGLILNRETLQPVALAGNVESYRARENPTPSARLTEPLQRKISELTDIQKHPDFVRLSEDERGYVESRLKELTAYQEYKARLERERPPADARSFDELSNVETRLQDSLGPPSEYGAEWSQTEAELLRQKWLDDIKAMRRAASEVSERYSGFTSAGNDLLQFKARETAALPWSEWQDRTRELLARAARPPYPENEPIRGSRAFPSMNRSAVTYGAVYLIRTVEDARREWDATRARLERLRDISLALGLVGDGSPDVSPLKLPEGITAEQSRAQFETLKKSYPKFADWSSAELSAVAASDVRAAAQSSYLRLIDAGRRVVLRELRQVAADGKESHERWKIVARALPESTDLRDWGQLARVLQRLTGDASGDPVTVLSEFLVKPTFSLKFNTIRVAIPDDAYESRLRPVGRLTIVHAAPGKTAQLHFARMDEETRDNRRRITTFTFVQEGDQGLEFTPGDAIYADLTVRDSSNTAREWKLSWLQSRSEMYRFESLNRVPRFYPVGEPDPTKGALKDIYLSFAPENGMPRVPELMPIVVLGK